MIIISDCCCRAMFYKKQSQIPYSELVQSKEMRSNARRWQELSRVEVVDSRPSRGLRSNWWA
jgi:hypothetical protein